MKIKIIMAKILIAAAFFAFTACVSVTYPPCVTPNIELVKIKWGDVVLATGEKKIYELDALCMVQEIKTAPGAKEDMKKEIGRIPHAKYCRIMELLKAEMLKTHTLNSAIDTARFVEYENPKISAKIRGMWNPRFDTYGSAGYREVYDSLQAALLLAE